MTNITFFIYFFFIPIMIGAVIARFIVIDDPDIKEFKVNMGLNWTIFALVIIGMVYVIWSDKRTLLDDWVTLGGFLAVTTINVTLGLVLKWRKARFQNIKPNDPS